MSQLKSEVAAWYVSRGGDAAGPFSTDMLLAMLRNSQLQPLDLVFREGESEWKPVATYRELKANSKENSVSAGAVSADTTQSSSAPTLPAANANKSDPRSLSWIVLRPHNSTYLQEGPLETQTIIDGLEKGRFQFSQYAWHAGMSQWMRIGDLREFDRRSRSRETKPHVPPPLPDPIAAVMLEDDSDSEAEEFHVSMRGNLKHDLTPNPLESMQAIAQLGSAAIGGAAAESPEQKASRAVSLVVSSGNLAGVPWEQDASDGYPQGVELSGEQNTDVHADLFGDDGLDQFTFTGSSGLSQSGMHDVATAATPLSRAEPTTVEEFERTPLPFVPAAPMPLLKDKWNKWGRHIAGGVMFVLLCFFSWHLVTHKSSVADAPAESVVAALPALAPAVTAVEPTNSATQVQTVADVASGTTVAATAPSISPATEVGANEFGKDAPDVGLPSTRAVEKKAVTLTAPVSPVTSPAAISGVSTSKDLGIVGVKLDRPDGQIMIKGSLPANAPVEVTFKGRLGQILSKINVRKTVTVARKGNETPTLRLKNLRLPNGAYTVEAKVANLTLKNEIFIGSRDAKFVDSLEAHLREISLETQTQKKVLFYAAQEMNVLARELGLNYGQLRAKPELWASFYSRWKQRMEMVSRSTSDLSRRSSDEQAFPEETAALASAQTSLKEVGNQFAQAIGQSRDMASDSLADLISELTRQKDAIGQATARPAASASDEKP